MPDRSSISLNREGGLIKKGKAGYLIAAFSGGPSEAEVKVSRAGLDVFGDKL